MVAMVAIFIICDLIVIETIVQSIATFINNISIYCEILLDSIGRTRDCL